MNFKGIYLFRWAWSCTLVAIKQNLDTSRVDLKLEPKQILVVLRENLEILNTHRS